MSDYQRSEVYTQLGIHRAMIDICMADVWLMEWKVNLSDSGNVEINPTGDLKDFPNPLSSASIDVQMNRLSETQRDGPDSRGHCFFGTKGVPLTESTSDFCITSELHRRLTYWGYSSDEIDLAIAAHASDHRILYSEYGGVRWGMTALRSLHYWLGESSSLIRDIRVNVNTGAITVGQKEFWLEPRSDEVLYLSAVVRRFPDFIGLPEAIEDLGLEIASRDASRIKKKWPDEIKRLMETKTNLGTRLK